MAEELSNANSNPKTASAGSAEGLVKRPLTNSTSPSSRPASKGAVGSNQPKSIKSGSTNRSSTARRSANAKGARSTDTPRPKRDWHHSGVTVFVLGILLLGVVVSCAAVYALNHHHLTAWMVTIGYAVGIAGTYVLMSSNEGESNDN
jgi:hypothetical protein